MFIDRIFYLDPALVAGVIVVALKVIFGRSWPDLVYERAGTDEFRWFAGEWARHRGGLSDAVAGALLDVAIGRRTSRKLA